jgi:hypothetical protein
MRPNAARLTSDQKVAGSSPARRTNEIRGSINFASFDQNELGHFLATFKAGHDSI